MYTQKILNLVHVCIVAIVFLPAIAIGDDVHWTGAGDGINWNDQQNWTSDPFLPGSGDDVFHLTFDAIQLDVDPDTPVEIASFSFPAVPLAEGLVIQQNRTLRVTNQFRHIGIANALYDLTRKQGARLEVGLAATNEELAWVNVTLSDGTALNPTEVQVNAVGEGDWDIGRFTSLHTNRGFVLAGWRLNVFTIFGEIVSEGPIWCGNDWTLLKQPGQTETPRVEVKDCSFEVNRLFVRDGSEVLLSHDDGICNFLNPNVLCGDPSELNVKLNVFEELEVNASSVVTDSAPLIAERDSFRSRDCGLRGARIGGHQSAAERIHLRRRNGIRAH